MRASPVLCGASVDIREVHGLSCRWGTVDMQGTTDKTTWYGELYSESGHPGVKVAIRSTLKWWESTRRRYTAAVETGKVRHVGRHGERHIGPVVRKRDVPDSRRGSRSGSRKEHKQVFVTDPVILVCSSRGRISVSHPSKTEWTSWETLEGASHKVEIVAARAPSSFSNSPF